MPPLPDELVEEIFLRLPKDEPAALVRASLASKPWLGVLTGPAFRSRYREFHGAPPMLGFFYSLRDGSQSFVSTTKFGMRRFTHSTHHHLDVWDCRHGRVLLGDTYHFPNPIVVGDPMTGCTRELEGPDEDFPIDNVGIAVLCAVSGCDHRSCHAGPFKIVYVGDVENNEAVAFVSSPDTGEWKGPCPRLDHGFAAFIHSQPAVLVDDALHFMLGYGQDSDRAGILKYSLSSDSLSLIDVPRSKSVDVHASILMAMKDGSLGFALVDRLTLYVWSRQIDSNGVASWTHRAVVDLNSLLPNKDPDNILIPIGSVEGGDIIFVNMDLAVYEIDLKTLEWKVRRKGEFLCAVIPYMSFYSPPERMIPGHATH